MADDDEGYVDSFEQADDNVLMAAVKQRDNRATPLSSECCRRHRVCCCKGVHHQPLP